MRTTTIRCNSLGARVYIRRTIMFPMCRLQFRLYPAAQPIRFFHYARQAPASKNISVQHLRGVDRRRVKVKILSMGCLIPAE